MKRWLPRLVVALFVLLLVGLLVYGYLPKPVPVDAARVTRGPLEVTVEDDGQTRLRERYVVCAPIAGVAARIELDPGDAVKAGEVVARLLPPESPFLDPQARAAAQARVSATAAAERQARATVDRAEHALADARRELARARQLAAGKAITAREVDQAKALARSRQSELQMARFGAEVAGHEAQLARAALGSLEAKGPARTLDLASPVAGEVLRVVHESEGMVPAGAPLLEVGDPADVEVVVDLLTQDAVQVAPGMPVIIDRWGGDRPLPGRVREVEPSAFTEVSPLGVPEQRVNVVVELEAPASERRALGDGYAVEARIVVWRADGVLQLPTSALFRHDDGWAAFAIENGRAVLRGVTIGRRTPLKTEMRGGLAQGAMVIVHPGESVRPGVAVAPR